MIKWLWANRTPIGVAVISGLVLAAALAAAGTFGNLLGGSGDPSSRASTTTTATPPPTAPPTTATESVPTATAPPASAAGSEPCVASPKAPPYEPNDSAPDAAGPLRAGKAYEGRIETMNDEDWYALCVVNRSQINATITSLSDARVGASLVDKDGAELTSTDASSNGSGSLDYTVDPGRYFIKVRDACCDERGKYRLRVHASAGLSDSVPSP